MTVNMKSKGSFLLITVLLLTSAFLGCQSSIDETANTIKKPVVACPRFGDTEATPQESQDHSLPAFIVTDFVETKSPDAWIISGVIQQREPILLGLKFDQLLIIFVFQDGRPCEFQNPDHGPLNDLVKPVRFVLQLNADNYRSAGFGFSDFQDFEATSRLDKILVQILVNKNKIQNGQNEWTGQFEADF